MMISMFHVPLITLNCEDWSKKKTELTEMIASTEMKNFDTINTNYFSQERQNYISKLESIFTSEINMMREQLGAKAAYVRDAWFEQAEQYMHHPVHHHGTLGYSAVCYIDYDKEMHSPITFMSCFSNFVTGDNLYYVPEVEEGTILFFPSITNHYTKPNMSEKIRNVVSLNLVVEP